MDAQLLFELFAENGIVKCFPSNDQSRRLCQIAGLAFLSPRAAATAHMMGFQLAAVQNSPNANRIRLAMAQHPLMYPKFND